MEYFRFLRYNHCANIPTKDQARGIQEEVDAYVSVRMQRPSSTGSLQNNISIFQLCSPSRNNIGGPTVHSCSQFGAGSGSLGLYIDGNIDICC